MTKDKVQIYMDITNRIEKTKRIELDGSQIIYLLSNIGISVPDNCHIYITENTPQLKRNLHIEDDKKLVVMWVEVEISTEIEENKS